MHRQIGHFAGAADGRSKPGRLKIYAAEAVISRRAQRTEQKRKQHGCGNGGNIHGNHAQHGRREIKPQRGADAPLAGIAKQRVAANRPAARRAHGREQQGSQKPGQGQMQPQSQLRAGQGGEKAEN